MRNLWNFKIHKNLHGATTSTTTSALNGTYQQTILTWSKRKKRNTERNTHTNDRQPLADGKFRNIQWNRFPQNRRLSNTVIFSYQSSPLLLFTANWIYTTPSSRNKTEYRKPEIRHPFGSSREKIWCHPWERWCAYFILFLLFIFYFYFP